jgi:hypothetical protein
MCAFRFGIMAAAIAALGVSCLPADTRSPPGSILLNLAAADPTPVTTVDGWSIAVDRLLLGVGDVSIGSRPGACSNYSGFDSRYLRLLDARVATEQKVNLVFGLGQCQFDVLVRSPDAETVLGEGVSELDRTMMGGDRPQTPRRAGEGKAIEFFASATRGTETKRIDWSFGRRIVNSRCGHAAGRNAVQPIELRSEESLAFHIRIRDTVLFDDDGDPAIAVLRFDPIAAADTVFGNGDGEITLDELGNVSMDVARQSGPYGVGEVRNTPRSLQDYINLILLPQLVAFREDIRCNPPFGG